MTPSQTVSWTAAAFFLVHVAAALTVSVVRWWNR